MISRFHALALSALFAAALAFALALPARAQAPDPHAPDQHAPNDEPLKPPEPPRDLPNVRSGDATHNLDKLFEALKVAPTDESAKYIERRIWALWTSAGGDTAGFLMGRVKTAVDSKDYDLAIKLLNAIIEIRPDYVEGWNRRATVYYMKKDFSHSLEDIREVLAREPRHFGALAGLGLIMQELGDDKRALDVYRRLIAIHPHMQRIPDLVKTLTEKVEGRDI